jgi:hypothetical protein
MEVSLETVMEAALQLPPSDQLQIASRLLETVIPDDGLLHMDDPALLAEIERRSRESFDGIPWSELRDEGLSADG